MKKVSKQYWRVLPPVFVAGRPAGHNIQIFYADSEEKVRHFMANMSIDIAEPKVDLTVQRADPSIVEWFVGHSGIIARLD